MSEHVINHPTPEEREAAGWVPDKWETVSTEPMDNGMRYKVIRRRRWERPSIEIDYEYLTRIE